MTRKPEKPFNSRKYQGQLENELIVGGILITIVVGGGLIALIWGIPAFLTALVCFAGVFGLLGLVWLLLKVFEILGRG